MSEPLDPNPDVDLALRYNRAACPHDRYQPWPWRTISSYVVAKCQDCGYGLTSSEYNAREGQKLVEEFLERRRQDQALRELTEETERLGLYDREFGR